jgi:hypothetical protein
MNKTDQLYESLKQGFVDILRKDFSRDDISKSRLDICNSCKEFIKSTTQCKKCGCFMKVKTRLSHSKCPLNKWKEV